MNAVAVLKALRDAGAAPYLTPDFRVLVRGKERHELPRDLVDAARGNVSEIAGLLFSEYVANAIVFEGEAGDE